MKDLSIIIAYKEDSLQRKRIFEWNRQRYEFFYPKAEIIIGEDDSNSIYFCKSRAINNAVRKSTKKYLLITDIDMILCPLLVQQGLELLRQGESNNKEYSYIIPYSVWIKMDLEITNSLLNSSPFSFSFASLEPKGMLATVHPRRGTGIHLISKNNFNQVFGYDERFVGWGGEDNAFGIAVRTLISKRIEILTGTAYHLYHPNQPTKKKKNNDNILLWREYQKYENDKKGMLKNIFSKK